ncbi:hypothetical protein UG55_100810 [Frankia sp. EI5c]|uniref:hypothetical protein n=1 Tax=Frankia sp. EI5c TaxID=683316 RepID=UPI0007C22CE9|nr:hypothetical protein [Frankia sp. EI5c]OAA27359.1 hypothetical protein UG55_100810 [Frankia sp. EI5c]
MADVSVRLQADAGTEIVLNLSVQQALRLVEAIAGRAADLMPAAGRAPADSRWQAPQTGPQTSAVSPTRPGQ